MKVKDIISKNQWDLSKISFPVPKDIKTKIDQIPMPLKAGSNDTSIWNVNTNGCFTSNNRAQNYYKIPSTINMTSCGFGS